MSNTNVTIFEMLTKGKRIERFNYFQRKNNYLYIHERFGRRPAECVIINTALIESDEKWMEKQHAKDVDLEMACAYLKVLEERFYPILEQVEQWQIQKTKLCHARRRKEHPEFDYKEEDLQELKEVKSYCCVKWNNEYSREIQKEMFEKLNPIRPIVEDFKELQEKCTEQHICKNLLYLGRKGKEDPSDLYEKEVEKISKVYKKFAKKHGLQEVLKESIETSEQEVSKAKDRLEKEATKYAFQMLFCVKEWNVETWIELIFLKFYRELEQNKPKLSFTEEGFMIALSNTETEPQNEEKETKESKEKGNAIATRRKWIGEQEKKWFEGNDTISCWKLKEAAVKSLVELEDEEKKMDLLNYRIALDKSKLKEMYWLILRSGERRKELEIEVGISDGGVQKRIKQETGKPKEISPFLACTLWNKSNFSFESVFQIQAEETTLQDAAVKNAYIEGLKEKTSRLIPPLKAVWENPEDDAFWYSPAIERSCTCICMEMYSMEKIRFTAEYASFLVEPLTIELPFSRVMYKIVQMAPEKALNIAKAAGYTTTWEYLKYCAEMMVRKYCNIYFDIPYAKFQEIKQFAKIKVFIKPMILRTPDGKRMVEYMSCFKKNKGEIYSIPREVVGRLADFTWETEEALREDWEQIKENIKAIVIEECKQWNKEAGEFSEFSMSQEDFFEYIFDQEEVVDESICEKEVLHWDLPDWPF